MEDDSAKREAPDFGGNCGDKCGDKCASRECASVQMGREIASEHMRKGKEDRDVGDIRAMADGFEEECRSSGASPLALACRIASREGFDIKGEAPADPEKARLFSLVKEVISDSLAAISSSVIDEMVDDLRDAILEGREATPCDPAERASEPEVKSVSLFIFGGHR